MPHIKLPEGLPGIVSAFAFRPENRSSDASVGGRVTKGAELPH